MRREVDFFGLGFKGLNRARHQPTNKVTRSQAGHQAFLAQMPAESGGGES
jgi:hypothetical protein